VGRGKTSGAVTVKLPFSILAARGNKTRPKETANNFGPKYCLEVYWFQALRLKQEYELAV